MVRFWERMTPVWCLAGRCRSNLAQIEQSNPGSGLGLQVKVLKTFEVVFLSLQSERPNHHTLDSETPTPSYSFRVDLETLNIVPAIPQTVPRKCVKRLEVHVLRGWRLMRLANRVEWVVVLGVGERWSRTPSRHGRPGDSLALSSLSLSQTETERQSVVPRKRATLKRRWKVVRSLLSTGMPHLQIIRIPEHIVPRNHSLC